MNTSITLAIIGAGPAGLMAAETAASMGVRNIHVFDAMPSVGRKLLLAGIGGLNLTHSESNELFFKRYKPLSPLLLNALHAFDSQALRQWCTDLGIETFIGSSGRVFPEQMKAAPLLRAWLARLKAQGIQFHSRHRWLGFSPTTKTDINIKNNITKNNTINTINTINKNKKILCFETPNDIVQIVADATVLALGGGSWRKLGSDGAWQSILASYGVLVNPLIPANCGFNVSWSDFFIAKQAGSVLKNIAINHNGAKKIGELVLTKNGVEGGLVYAHSHIWRDGLHLKAPYVIYIDLLPHHSNTEVLLACQSHGSRSLSGHLNSRLKLNSAAFTLLRECLPPDILNNPIKLAQAIKNLPISLLSTRPLNEAISSAGGVAWESLGHDYQLHNIPTVFCTGEMLDWEAPTGGYLLTACWATGRAAGVGVGQLINQWA
jgi:uncharacterized flavoprotein (TIGR03862 family)